MGKKYIIELENKPFHKEDGDFLYRVKGFNSLVFDMTGVSKLTPYTEPDLEQVRCQAYEEGRNSLLIEVQKAGKNTIKLEEDEYYQRGLSDAWEAARKILFYPNDGGMGASDVHKVFDGKLSWEVLKYFTASEAIEKIRQYEQKQEEIKVGDEVELDDGETAIWMRDNSDEDTAYLMFSDGSCGSNENSEIVRKTGRHFPEIAEVLRKMQEE